MTRRRLTLVAIAITLLVGWWTWHCRLSSVERQLVGVWHYDDGKSGESNYTAHLEPDGRFWTEPAHAPAAPAAPCLWSVQGDCMVFDYETRKIHRMLRPVKEFIGMKHWSGLQPYVISVTTDRVEYLDPNEPRHVWMRVLGG